MQDLLKERNELNKLLNEALTSSRNRGLLRAKKEREYKTSLNKRILLMRSEGIPVTIINDLARGEEDIAHLRFERDNADVLYRSSMEAINIYKLQLRIIEAQINRDWGNPNNQ